MNLVFANQDDEDAIYPLTTSKIAEAQKHDTELDTIAKKYGYTIQLVENTKVLCKDRENCNSNKPTQSCSSMVSPLPSTPPGTCISRKLFVSQCIGKVYKRQFNHTSKNVIVVR